MPVGTSSTHWASCKACKGGCLGSIIHSRAVWICPCLQGCEIRTWHTLRWVRLGGLQEGMQGLCTAAAQITNSSRKKSLPGTILGLTLLGLQSNQENKATALKYEAQEAFRSHNFEQSDNTANISKAKQRCSVHVWACWNAERLGDSLVTPLRLVYVHACSMYWNGKIHLSVLTSLCSATGLPLCDAISLMAGDGTSCRAGAPGSTVCV